MQAVFCRSWHSRKVVEGRTVLRGNAPVKECFKAESIFPCDSEQRPMTAEFSEGTKGKRW